MSPPVASPPVECPSQPPDSENPLRAGLPDAVPGSGQASDGEIESTPTPDDDAHPPVADADPKPDQTPLPQELLPADGPPLPSEAPPSNQEDDGWDCQWDPTSQTWFFFNRFTGKSQWENPRMQDPSSSSATPARGAPQPPRNEAPAAGGYNPALHGDYDPQAWYAQGYNNEEEQAIAVAEQEAVESANAAEDLATAGETYGVQAQFNRFTGHFQSEDMGPGRHSDEARSRRQMNAFFDVDAAANAHDGRSLKAERSNKKPSKTELKAFKEKRRVRKEEKRRAWLRD